MKISSVYLNRCFGLYCNPANKSRRSSILKPEINFKGDEFVSHPNLKKYTSDFYGLTLLNQTNSFDLNAQKLNSAIYDIQDAAAARLYGADKIPECTKENPCIWSVTSEFAPIKEGGLGSVPPEIRNNAHRLGVDMPTFIPMYLNEGISSFCEDEDGATYTRGNNEFALRHALSYKMDIYKDGVIQKVPVDIYLNEDENKNQLIFIKCDKYFDGTIYESSAQSEENEKFAIFSKAIYEFAKLKLDGTRALKDVRIYSKNALDKIQAPDMMLLNDWQASPVAALMRYKAPVENAYNHLSNATSQKLKNMRILSIGHNCKYQGSTLDGNNSEQRKTSTNNILNTLFDKYASIIVPNAHTRASSTNPSDAGLKNLDNALIVNYMDSEANHLNFLNTGVLLSDCFLPVSQNYANELVSDTHPELSGIVQWALVQKNKTHRLIGIINGNDYNSISLTANKDKIKKTTGLDFEPYSKKSSKDCILESKMKNKINLYKNYMMPLTESPACSFEMIADVKEISKAIEIYKGKNNTSLPDIDDETLKNTPVISLVGRLVEQKGADIATSAIKTLFDNWEQDFPDKNKPVIYIAGSDNEGGRQRAKIEKLKDDYLEKSDSDRVVFAHGFVPVTAIMAASDFFLMPSKFEPCGLTQSEAMAVGTPVIATCVGGIADTVNRNNAKTGFLTDKDNPTDTQELYNTMKKALKVYFESPNLYQKMVINCAREDFSWIQKDKQGPVYEYLELFGLNRDNLADTISMS